MTMKKSNVKALALVVTCAILAGGGVSLTPVYAAPEPGIIPTTGPVTYDRISTELKYASSYDIRELTVNGVTIGGEGIPGGRIIAKEIVGGKGLNPSAISINGATFADGGAITATSLKLNGIDDIKTAIEAKAAQTDVDNNKASISDLQNSKADAANVYTKTESDSNFARKNYEGKVDALETTVNNVSTGLNAANGKITALEGKTTGISYDSEAGTTVNDVTFNAGAVSGVKSINDKIKISDDGTVTINENATNNPVTINSKGIKVGNNSAVVSEDGFKTSGDLYVGTKTNPTEDAIDARFYVKGADGSLKAADGKFTVNGTNGETVVTGTAGTTTITGGGVTISKVSSGEYVSISEGSVLATDSIKAANVISAGLYTRINDGKVVAKNGLYVGYSSTDITGATYDNSKFAVDGATGNTTVGGNLTVNGAANFAQETTFANGIKTDKINEKNDGKGVTVDGVLLKDGGITATGNVTTTGDIQGNNITATGVLKGQTLGIGTNGSEFTVDENGNAAVGGTLGVTGKTTLSDELQVDKTATFGSATGAKTVINGDEVKTGRIETTKTQSSYIGGVTLLNGQITADNMTITGTLDMDNLKVNEKLEVGTYGVTKAGVVTGVTSINDVAVSKQGNGLKIGSATVGDINPFSSTGFTVDNVGNVKAVKVTAGTITDGNGFTATGGNVTATGTVQGNTISDGAGATLTSGKITAKEGQIGNVTISAAGEVTGVKSIEASTFKVDEDNYLNNSGITAKGGHIGGAVIDATTLTVGVTKLDSTEGITTNKLKIGDMALTGTGLNTGTNDFQVNGVTFNQGKVTAQADKGFVAGTSSFKEGSLIVDANNKLEATHGLTTEKATVNGTLDVTGKATFGTAGKQTTIDGDAITTDTLKANKLILGASGNATVEVDKDGSLKAANGKFAVDKDGALKAANGAFNVDKDGKTTFTKDADNLSSINGGNIWAKATDIADNTSSELTHDYKGLHIKGNKSGQKSAFDFDTASGIGTFTGQDNSTTKINGSAIRSEKIDGTAGKLDGENLTLYKDPNNQTIMSAGKATFTGDAGEKGGKVTTINGGTITTDTLNVERINLGEDILDSNGNPHGSNLSMDKQGNFSAAGGNFKVTGGSGADKGAFTNTVGNTTLQTDNAGASMKFDNTAAAGGVTSEVAVEANKATVAAGEKASFVATTDNGGTATITGGTQTVTTTDKGTVFENSAHKTAFVDNGATNTIINGNEITTGKITTDQLVITGKGNADGNGGSIAFGGNGTIKSDINDGTTNGKNTSFETTLNGVNTKVTNGTTTTENKVTAAGNSNTVKQDDTHKSEFNQGLTSIGGVVTNGEIKVAQKLDGATGLLTNEVTDANGSSKLEQSGTGLTYTDSANAGNATRIDSSDVSIGSATNDKDRINLSDLGQIDDLDQEIRDNEVYKNNETAVGGINAEAAIRRGEVERLDNRISEEVTRLDGRINDVSDRVNKVGAMAAAIASLKSIGYDPQAPSEFSIGLGQYKGETGVAMGFFHYPNKNFMINVSLSTAGGETMGGIGATWRFGHKSPQKLLEEQREEQAKKELAAAEKYQAAAKLAKEAQERAEYAAKLARQAQVSADNAKAAADATQAKHFG